MFNPLKPEDMEEARQILLNDAVEKALANGLLENADENAKNLLKVSLSGIYNLEEYKIVFVYVE